MSAGDVVGRVQLDEWATVTVREHGAGRALHIVTTAVAIIVDLDARQAAELARLLVEPAS